MINDNNNRPRFDTKTGKPIYYADEVQNTNTEYRYAKDSIPHNQEVTGNNPYNRTQNNNVNSNMYNVNNTYNAGSSYNINNSNTTNSANTTANTTRTANSAYTSYNANSRNSYNTSSTVNTTNTANYNSVGNAGFAGNGNINNPGQPFGSAPNMANTKLPKKKKEKTKPNAFVRFFKHKATKLVASALAFGLIAGSVMYGVYYTGVKVFPNSSDIQSQDIAPIANISSNKDTDLNVSSGNNGVQVQAVAKVVLPAMVQIEGVVTVSDSYYGYGTSQAKASGSGIIVGKNDTELLILTNAHVVDEVSDLKCIFVDNTSISCQVKGSKSEKDIAVVAVKLSDVNSSTLEKITIAELGDSDDVEVGQQVVAIGNALGEGQSVTTGIISAVNRSITVNNTTFSGLFLTDAAINSGNSGGALLNGEGKVIGINFAKSTEDTVEGMAYSIPVSNVKDIINNLMNIETRDKVDESNASYLGISGLDITSSMSASYGYPQGIMIRQVSSGSPADEAGLEVYDIIVSFDDQSVTSMSSLKSLMKYYAAGETVNIGYYHKDGNEYVLKTTQLTLGKKGN